MSKAIYRLFLVGGNVGVFVCMVLVVAADGGISGAQAEPGSPRVQRNPDVRCDSARELDRLLDRHRQDLRRRQRRVLTIGVLFEPRSRRLGVGHQWSGGSNDQW